ncbi:MAG: hypothetical protein R3F07_14460 [Opitutaceae bacterium]
MAIRTINLKCALAFWVTGLVALCLKADPFYAGLLFLPFALGPQILTHLAIVHAKSKGAQITLTVALVGYFAWFCLVFIEIFYRHPDPQGAVALLFVGVYATPAMLVLWLLVAFFEHRWKKAKAPGNV